MEHPDLVISDCKLETKENKEAIYFMVEDADNPNQPNISCSPCSYETLTRAQLAEMESYKKLERENRDNASNENPKDYETLTRAQMIENYEQIDRENENYTGNKNLKEDKPFYLELEAETLDTNHSNPDDHIYSEVDIAAMNNPDINAVKNHPDFKKGVKMCSRFKLLSILILGILVILSLVMGLTLSKQSKEQKVLNTSSEVPNKSTMSAEGDDFSDEYHRSITNCDPCLEYLTAPRMVIDVSALNPDIGHLVRCVQALPHGGALVGEQYKATQVNDTGDTVRTLLVDYVGDWVTGFVLLDQQDVLILQTIGQITRFDLSSGNQTAQYKTNIRDLYGGAAVDNNNILLVVGLQRKIWKYNIINGTKEEMIQLLTYPRAVVEIPTPQKTLYAVCESSANKVTLYNRSWGVQASIGSQAGSGNNELDGPWDVTVLPDHTLLVSDSRRHRISAYNTKGAFIKLVIKERHGLQNPHSLSFSQHNNHLWVTEATGGLIPGKLRVYQILRV